MNHPQRSVSATIDALPDTFELHGVVAAAKRLIQVDDPSGKITARQVNRYVEQQLVDPPSNETQPYRHRHLLQIVAIHTLKGLGLEMTRIRELVRGVDDGYLRMLCDEPVEAEKKAAVMSNWLKMLNNGRVGRHERGETHLLHAPNPEPVQRQVMHVAPVRNNRGPAPSLDLTPATTRKTPRPVTFAPPGHPGEPANLSAGQPPIDLPDELPTNRRAPLETRNLRSARPTFAASQSLADAVRRRMEGPALERTPRVAVQVPAINPDSDAGKESYVQDEASTEVAPALPQAWTRLRVAEGVELHVQVGRAPVPADAIDGLLAQIRSLISE